MSNHLTVSTVFIVTTAVGVQARPAAAPQTGPFDKDFQLVGDPSFTEAVTAISSLIFAFSGTPAFFSIAAEMRDPTQYNKSLLLCQSVVTTVYTIIGCVVYYYCGVYVASPALGSAGGTIKKIAYGFAIPGLIATTVITVHVSAPAELVHKLYANVHVGTGQIPARPISSRLQASRRQLEDTLVYLARLCLRLRHYCIYHRQCYPCLWWSRLTHRCSPRNPHVVPAYGLHVAIRQLGYS